MKLKDIKGFPKPSLYHGIMVYGLEVGKKEIFIDVEKIKDIVDKVLADYFEDSPRAVESLANTIAKACLIKEVER